MEDAMSKWYWEISNVGMARQRAFHQVLIQMAALRTDSILGGGEILDENARQGSSFGNEGHMDLS